MNLFDADIDRKKGLPGCAQTYRFNRSKFDGDVVA